LGEINVGVTAAAELLIHPGKRPAAHWARGRSRPGGSGGRARLYRLAWESPRRISELLRGSAAGARRVWIRNLPLFLRIENEIELPSAESSLWTKLVFVVGGELTRRHRDYG